MARAWLEERLRVLLPALQALDVSQENEIARLCAEELAAWKARPDITMSSLRPVMTQARKAIRERLKVTPANRYKDLRTNEWQHLALKYLNFTKEEWDSLNAIPDAQFEERLKNQQVLEHPREIIARAEKLLQSERWYDLVAGLAVATGRRLGELLKSGRFFPKTRYTLVFDGQLKRRDLDLKPYEIPVLVDAEIVLMAWRRLRALEDTSQLDIGQVEQKYSRDASAAANRHFTGLIPQRSTKDNLYTHGLRAVYAQLAVWCFCPKSVNAMLYANTILGQYQAHNERQMRDFLTTAHYFDYYIDGGQGNRLGEPGVEVLEVFQKRGDSSMTSTDTSKEQASVLTTAPHKTRGTLTTSPATFKQVKDLMERRQMSKHDEILADLLVNDATAHQMYDLLAPLAEELHTSGPIATLQALIAAYRAGGNGAGLPGLRELLQEVAEEKDGIAYLRKLVKRDRDFQVAIASRHAGTDYSTLAMGELERIKTTEAATERFRRATDAIIAHNNAQTDPLHLWYINAAAIRDLVGGRNDAVQSYLEARKSELEAHHKQYNLTPRQNRKNMSITDEIKVE